MTTTYAVTGKSAQDYTVRIRTSEQIDSALVGRFADYAQAKAVITSNGWVHVKSWSEIAAAPVAPIAPISTTVSAGPTPTLTDYDIILVNSSAGKDSQVTLDVVAKIARRAGIEDRVIVVHADLGERIEWEGTGELAAEQAAHYGFRYEVVRKEGGDLLDYVENRARTQAAKVASGESEKAATAWPSSSARYCTSDFKTGPVRKLMTRLVRESGITDRPVRILNCLGIRAEESSARAKRVAYEYEEASSNGKRHVDRWLPIHMFTEVMVWARIKASGVRYHHAYDLGMTRLSCKFCVLGSKGDLACAIQNNPEDADEYVAVEQRIEGMGVPHRFTHARSMAEAVAEVRAA